MLVSANRWTPTDKHIGVKVKPLFSNKNPFVSMLLKELSDIQQIPFCWKTTNTS